MKRFFPWTRRSGTRAWAAAVCLAALALSAPAAAHTSYLMPSAFSTARADVVTLQASFAEDFYFRPEVAVESQDFHLYRPDGRRDSYDTVQTLRQVTMLESDLTEEGTYRFTTGERLGRTTRQALIDGEWRPLAADAAPPRRARVRTSQTATVADVYVTKGAPTDAVLAVNVGRLAIRPLTHPNAVFVDDGFSFVVTFDGAPLANQEIVIDREGGDYEEPRFHNRTMRTGADGRALLSFDRPGVYLIMTRHRAPAPAGAETDERSYTTSLTFEVTR
jgi:uncharacterized GH25 family protein